MARLFLFFLAAVACAQNPKPAATAYPQALVSAGQSKFVQECGFCHGRDAGGGEDGPDLTRSKLVAEDIAGDKIGPVVRNGRPQTGMPRFTVSDQELAELVAFIHTQKTIAESQKGGRRGVDVSDLQTGNAEAGKRYFNGAGQMLIVPLRHRRPGRSGETPGRAETGRAPDVSERRQK